MNKVIIIAEAGVNHNGDIELAKKLIDVAVTAGVDYVKFQTFKSENLVSKAAKKADYQIENTHNATESQLQMLKKLELSHDQHQELITYCKKMNISFFSTAFDLESLGYLKELGLSMVKIPSGEITNLPYLRKAASLFSEVIISSGMSTMQEISDALDVFIQSGISKENITILHCNTEYPTPMQDVNLNAMLSIHKEFGVNVGYSDHTLGIEVPIAAVAMGANVIEKHFTLDRNLPGPDQLASLEPDELKAMVQSIRNIESAISGNGIKEPSESEKKNIFIVRKSLHFNKDLEFGHVLSEEDIIALRPGTGISPMKISEYVGRQLIVSVKSNSMLTDNCFI
jgi:N,N'-diacetyllegionaminate synthase